MTELLDRLQSFFGDTYAIERELGGGGMSRVFLAEEAALGRKVVIKVLPPDMAAGINRERFERETQLAASLQHPLIVPILTAGSAAPAEPDLLYYVMPFIDGHSLRERVDREGELPIQEGARIMRDVADALARAHEAGVVHRDVKPDNVMLSGKHAMVTDFGIAKAVSVAPENTSGGLTQMGMSLGTPMYMSPEQAAGDPNVDHRADIYSLGVMAYEMFTGRLPLEAESAQGLLAAHISETPRPIRELRPSIPVVLAEAVMRCLEKKPADRWQSADQLSSMLDTVSGSTGAMTPVTTQAINVDAFVTTQPPVRVAGTFVLAGGILLGVVYLAMIQLGLPDWTFRGTAVVTGAAVVLGTLSAARRGVGWTTTRKGLTGAYGLLAAGVITYSIMRVLGIGPVGTLVAAGVLDDQGRLILAQFVNRTSDSTLSESVTELLRIDLSQSETVTLMAPRQVAQVLRRMQRDPNTVLTSELAREVAEREGVKAVLGGEIRSLAGEYIVSATLVETSTGETLAAARETASGGSLVDAVDRLSATLRERIGESLRTIRADAPLEDVTTVSTDALRLYAQANRANNANEQDRAIALLEQAIEGDSLFAMAHRKLAIVLSNQSRDRDRAVEAFTRAYELRDRLTDRERLLAEAAYHTYVADDENAAELAYTMLLDRYPSESTALNNLAVNYRGQGRMAEAVELYRRSIDNGGAPSVTFTNAIQTQYSLGMLDSATSTLERFAEEYPGHPSVPNMRAATASAAFDYDRAEVELSRWEEQSGGNPLEQFQIVLLRASIHGIHGQLEQARRRIREAFAIQERAGFTFIPQPAGVLEAVIGGMIRVYYHDDPEGAVIIMDQELAAVGYDTLPVGLRDDFQVATVYARAGATEKAREVARRNESDNGLSEGEEDRTIGLWGVYGAIAAGEERYEEAVRAYRTARNEATGCDLCFLPELGEAYMLAGEIDSATAVLERYLETPSLQRAQRDNFNLWYVLILLGETYEAAGRAEEAALAYSRLVDLWETPDEGLQRIVDDLTRRVARLTGETAGR